ncbi:hypothetical protein HUJ05_010179 [Dendroctonus ponderosae]|nr:hypothetical protein HUJ05_010179 [Dendroctonus ponderosae]
MFFTIEEMVKWLGLTVFEIWITLLSLLTFTIMLAVKFDPDIEFYNNDWWLIFLPLFVGDALNAYFCIIVFIRMIMETTLKFCIMKLCWSVTFLSLVRAYDSVDQELPNI